VVLFVLIGGTYSFPVGFYEHFEASAEARTIDAFVQAGSGAYLEVYGPLSLEEIRSVRLLELVSLRI
jgi:hypothetical protein